MMESAVQASDSDMSSPQEAMADRLRLCVPHDLWGYRQWLVWRYEPGQDKPRKVPYYVAGGRRSGVQGAAADLAGLTTFEQAEEIYRAGGYDGVGLAILESSPIKAIDLDACVGPNGAILAQAELILNQADSYSEFSPSGGGVRILVYGAMPSAKAMHRFGPGRHLELFGTSGFVTITGNILGDTVVRPMAPEFRNWLCEQAGAASRPGETDTREIPLQLIDATQAGHLRLALQTLDPDDYHQWINDGIALKCLGKAGLEIWLEQGRRSPRFDLQQALAKWAGFKPVKASYQSIFARAQGKGWINPMARAADRAVVDESTAGPWVLTLHDVLQSPDVGWSVEDVIAENRLGVFYGASGTFKSFLLFDLLMHMACGMRWMGKDTVAGKAVLVSGEGQGGLKQRVQAWIKHHGVAPPHGRIFFVNRSVVINRPEEVTAMYQAIREACPDPLMVGIDTFSQTFSGNENDNGEVADYLRSIRKHIMVPLGCGAILVHHSGHGVTERPRGASVFINDTDYIYSVRRTEEKSFITEFEGIKQKDGAIQGIENFILNTIDLGLNAKGRNISSLVATHSNVAEDLLKATDKNTETNNSRYMRFADELGNGELIDREFKNELREMGKTTDQINTALSKAKKHARGCGYVFGEGGDVRSPRFTNE